MAPKRFRIKPPPAPADGPVTLRYPSRRASVGAGVVRRALPHPHRRLIGAWCFLDHFGPTPVRGDRDDIGVHPHIGLQTVTWLLSGEMLHLDSIGSRQRIRPGQLSWMTAGRGIAHAELAQTAGGGSLHGVQLWVALPGAHRRTAPGFVHHDSLPVADLDGAQATVLVGELGGVRAATHTFSPLVGADITVPDRRRRRITLRPDFEHGAVVLEGAVSIEGEHLTPGTLLYLGTQRRALAVQGAPAGRWMLVGGAPLREDVLIWWNYVFRDPEEVRDVVADWNRPNRLRFPDVPGYTGPRIPSPEWNG